MNEDFNYTPEILCRTCLQTPKKLINVFESKGKKSIYNKLLECTTVQVKKTDNLPMNICKNCLDRLNTAYEFKIMVIQSDEKLREMFNRETNRNSSNIEEDCIKIEEFNVVRENTDETIDNNENIESEVIKTEVHIKEETEVCFEESNIVDDICENVDDVTNKNCNIQDVAIHAENNKETEDTKLKDDDFRIESSDVADYEKLKTTLSRSERKRTTLFCKGCNKSYRFDYYFEVHLPTHIGQCPYKCEICGKSYAKKGILQKHMMIHEAKKFFCEVCGLSFRYARSVRQHMLIHTGEFPHKCNICEKMYRQRGHLKDHIRTHTGERPYVCDVCGRAFKERSNFNNHTATHNVVNEFSCTKCGKLFKTKKNLKDHMRRHTEIKPYVCSDCSKRFTSKTELQRHSSVHTGAKPYSCNVCGKTFGRSSNVTSHMRVHTGEKPYPCKLCPAAFKYPDNLRNHMKTHKSK